MLLLAFTFMLNFYFLFFNLGLNFFLLNYLFLDNFFRLFLSLFNFLLFIFFFMAAFRLFIRTRSRIWRWLLIVNMIFHDKIIFLFTALIFACELRIHSCNFFLNSFKFSAILRVLFEHDFRLFIFFLLFLLHFELLKLLSFCFLSFFSFLLFPFFYLLLSLSLLLF